MSKILLFSDIHIHKHKRSVDRLHDCLKVLEWVFEVAKTHDIRDIVFAGDLFQDRTSIDILTYSLTFDILFKHCDGTVNVWLLLGNHDLWYHDKWDVSSVLPFSALPNVTVINKVSTYNIAGVEIDFLPYVVNPIERLKEFNPAKTLVGHLAVHGAELNTLYHSLSDVILEHDGDMVKIGPELFKGWNKVFLGHYHGSQKIDNIEYIGSPLQLNFGEAFQQKHLIIYDLNTGQQEYIINEFSPKHLVLGEDEVHCHEIKDNFVRITVEDKNSVDVLDLKKDIQDKKPGTLEIISKPKKEIQQVVEDAKSILHKEDEMLDKYVEEVDTGILDKSKLKDVGKTICNV